MNKFFNGGKYYFDKSIEQWLSTSGKQTFLSHDTWNFFHPDDPILKGDGYVIHHENGDSSDNRIENLRKMKFGKHSKIHHIGKHCSSKTKQKISNANLGHIVTDEVKQKISDAHIGSIVTDETKQKLRDANLGKENPMFGKKVNHNETTKQKLREANLGDKNPNWKGGKND